MKGFACKLSPATFTHFCIAFTFTGLREDVVLTALKVLKSFSKELQESYISDMIWWRTLEMQILMIFLIFSEVNALKISSGEGT